MRSQGPRSLAANCREIIVRGATARPTGYTIKRFANPTEERLHSEGDTNDMLPEEHFDRKFDGVGWNWEADDVARCLKGESQRFRIAHSV